MSSFNPLHKYFRQPKLFLAAPSRGVFYTEGTIQGDHQNIPVCAMTGMDELILKTPDALFSGESTIKVIESCCPSIKDAGSLPGIDVDAFVISIRIATYGEKMTVEHKCRHCSTDNDYEIDLGNMIAYLQGCQWKGRIQIDELVVNLRPLTYKQISQNSIDSYSLQRQLMNLGDADQMSETERQALMDSIYKRLTDIQVNTTINHIESVELGNETVTNPSFVNEWLRNTESSVYEQIKKKIEENRDIWKTPNLDVKCSNCGADNQVSVTMDQSSFFERSS